MTKTYKCKCDKRGILVFCKNKPTHVNFKSGVIAFTGLRGCYFTTDDKDLQRAIENYKDFGRESIEGIWTDDVEPEEEKQVVEAVESVEVPTEPAPIKRGRKPKAE